MATRKNANNTDLKQAWVTYLEDPGSKEALDALAEMVHPLVVNHVYSIIRSSGQIGRADYEDLGQKTLARLFMGKFLIGNKELARAST